jgi:seryl-tRNA synthetase
MAPSLSPSFTASDGLATLGPAATRVLQGLESCFLSWIRMLDAVEMTLPPLLRIADLERIDYFSNFPQLGMLASSISLASWNETDGVRGGELPQVYLNGTRYALPSAACYGIYFHLENQTLERSLRITTRGQCFRNEASYTGMTRLRGFLVRETVCIGTSAEVLAFLERFGGYLRGLADHLKLPVAVQSATDPFYDRVGSRAAMQKLFPVKHEVLYKEVALASTNFHRNFFAERCNIRLSNGQLAFTGCVGMGLERWIWALADAFDGDIDAILTALCNYRP